MAPAQIRIFVDADACPVKDEAYKVAARYRLKTLVVANSFMMVPKDPLIERAVVAAGPDAADDWIVERAGPADVVVTADIPLAHRCVTQGVTVIAPDGRRFDDASIGAALATRNLMQELRSAGETTSGPRPFTRTDRSRFLSTLDVAIVRLKRAGFGAAAS